MSVLRLRSGLLLLASILACVAKECTIAAKGDGTDDSAAIIQAFRECRQDSHITFTNRTYNIETTLNTTTLSNVVIDIKGTLKWSKNTTYWLENSIPVGYQNQSTVWMLGGSKLTVRGFGYGTIDGNGQTWYDLVKGISNYPRRPMGVTIWGATDSIFQGLRFVQSQMWTMAIMHSQNVTMDDIYVSSVSSNSNAARNTDGADVLFSDDITMRGWLVDNGDDAIAIKANSTNILIEDSQFLGGQGLAIGSVGQYDGKYERVENVTARNLVLRRTKYAAYVKTWTGEPVNYPPNGGGGGLGSLDNVVFENFRLDRVRAQALSISQCTTFSGRQGDCDSSLFRINGLTARNFTGTIGSDEVANVQCAAESGACGPLRLTDMRLTYTGTNAAATGYVCSNVKTAVGFTCIDCPDSSCGAHGS